MVPSLNLETIDEYDADADEREQIMSVEPAPRPLRGLQQFKHHRQPTVREPAPLVTRVHSFTVANVDSIGLVDRMCRNLPIIRIESKIPVKGGLDGITVKKLPFNF